MEESTQQINLVLRELLKTVKVIATYPDTNPLPQSLRRTFAESLVAVVREHAGLELTVENKRLLWQDQVVYEDSSDENCLAGMLFGGGITGVRISEKLDEIETQAFLEALREFYSGNKHDRDLVRSILSAKLACFKLATLDDIALREYDDEFDIEAYLNRDNKSTRVANFYDEDEQEDYDSIFTVELDEEQETSPSELITKTLPFHQANRDARSGELPDTTIMLNDEFELSNSESERIRAVVARDLEFDPYRSTLDLLKELLTCQDAYQDFQETVVICEHLHSEFIHLAKLSAASRLLGHLTELHKQLQDSLPKWADRLKETSITLGSRDRLTLLAGTLNAHPEINPVDLTDYLEHFGWETLAGITDLLGDLEHKDHRLALRDLVATHGHENTDLVAQGIFDKRWYVVRNSVTILARIGNEKAVSYLKKVVAHPEIRVRQELVQALVACPAGGVAKLLGQMAYDADRTIHRAAVKGILKRNDQEAAAVIANLVHDPNLKMRNNDDQAELLRVYSILGPKAAHVYLRQVITKLNLFGDRRASALRAAAFKALSRDPSQEALQVLQSLVGSWRPAICRGASEAVRDRAPQTEEADHANS